MADLYLDAEWFIGGDIFLLGWCRTSKVFGQMFDDTLTEENFQSLLDGTTGIIYFYGPDIGIVEKYFGIDIRSNYHCVNLLKVFKDSLPGLKNYKLATIEKLYHVNRSRTEYKANIFSIFQDWRKPHVRSLVLQYNREDVINLCKLKQMIFAQYDIEEDYLQQVRLAGIQEIIKEHVYLLPCDVYRGKNSGKYSGGTGEPNITGRLVISAKFYDDKVSLFRMIVLLADQVKQNQYDLVTPVNGRDSAFDLAKALAKGVAAKNKIPYAELLSNHNASCSPLVNGKKVLIIDDVIYRGRTMKAAIDAAVKQKPALIHFLAFGKSARFAY